MADLPNVSDGISVTFDESTIQFLLWSFSLRQLRKGGREGARERGSEGGREGERERGRERERERERGRGRES